MTQSNIIEAQPKFQADASGLPNKIYTDFDPKLIKGDTEKWLLNRIPGKPWTFKASNLHPAFISLHLERIHLFRPPLHLIKFSPFSLLHHRVINIQLI
jgi:hypothetical protein